MTDEEDLIGGNASGRVTRIGATVRKPWLPTTPRTIDYMAHVRRAGVDVPEVLGRDEQGRLVLTYVPGALAVDEVPLEAKVVGRVGSLVRSIHDASADLPVPTDWPVLIPAPAPDLLCHNDLAAWNLVIDGDRLVFIDWDGAGPSSRLWDLAYAAISFAHLFPDADVDACAIRLAAFVDGYGVDAGLRAALPVTLSDRARAMWRMLRDAHADGREPWATMYLEGHGEVWERTITFITDHRSTWHDALTHTI